MNSIATSPLVGGPVSPRDRRARLLLFVLWCGLVAWFLSDHVIWRDEMRAFSLALSGSNFAEMLANVQGEGHPAIWYIVLRGLHELLPYREVLPIAGAMLGIAAMATLAFLSPFRTGIIALILFSAYGAFEYVVMARNYGVAALIMFAIAALYSRAKNSLWFGLLLALLCNTNVPSCILAAFFLLFRFVEMLSDRSASGRREWLIFIGNAVLAAIGAWLCFRTVYPTFNDGVVSANLASPTLTNLAKGLVDTKFAFHKLGHWPPLLHLLLLASCFAFVRTPAALCASLGGLIALKLFFYMIYLSDYRHEVLFIIFLISLHWMVATGAGSSWREKRWMTSVRIVGLWVLVELLAIQSVLLFTPIRHQIQGLPESRSADVAALLQRPELQRAILMGDPDVVLEPMPYYVDNPIWLLREQRFGKVAHLVRNSRSELTLDHVLADATRLHRQTGRPIVYLSKVDLERHTRGRFASMFHNVMVLTPESRARFRASTRHVARLRPAGSDERYDVYVFPR